jgi:HD-GYP domain-containing protein (c-di-GMP phosphodiesterase class II)
VPFPGASPVAFVSREQALLYAKELREALCREREHTVELEARLVDLAAARQQLTAYAQDLKAAFDTERARQAEVLQSHFDAIHVLAAAVEARDPYTGGHIERVTHYALHIARQLGWSESRLVEVQMGAALHDIGKIGVNDSVLRSSGPLDPDEWAQMRTHPELGARILEGVGFFRSAIPYVLCHQERFDGRGYPFGLQGEAIPIEGRLVAVADAFDAITTDRPYRPARSPAEALAAIRRDAGTYFDPQVVNALVRAWPEIQAAMPESGPGGRRRNALRVHPAR